MGWWMLHFPPLLDNSEVEEHLTPKILKLDCMEHASTNKIMDTQVKGTLQNVFKIYHVIKARNLLHQGKWLTYGQIQQKFPRLMGEIKAIETISS
jgi:hypothetical protein